MPTVAKSNHHSLRVRKTERSAAAKRKLARFRRLLRLHLPKIQERYDVATLGVFGSYVRGEARPSSDINVLVTFNTAPSMFKFIDLQEYLVALLGVKVDLVPRFTLKPAIGQRILAEVTTI